MKYKNNINKEKKNVLIKNINYKILNKVSMVYFFK